MKNKTKQKIRFGYIYEAIHLKKQKQKMCGMSLCIPCDARCMYSYDVLPLRLHFHPRIPGLGLRHRSGSRVEADDAEQKKNTELTGQVDAANKKGAAAGEALQKQLEEEKNKLQKELLEARKLARAAQAAEKQARAERDQMKRTAEAKLKEMHTRLRSAATAAQKQAAGAKSAQASPAKASPAQASPAQASPAQASNPAPTPASVPAPVSPTPPSASSSTAIAAGGAGPVSSPSAAQVPSPVAGGPATRDAVAANQPKQAPTAKVPNS